MDDFDQGSSYAPQAIEPHRETIFQLNPFENAKPNAWHRSYCKQRGKDAAEGLLVRHLAERSPRRSGRRRAGVCWESSKRAN